MRLKLARKAAGLTQQQVADLIGINQNTYSYWENGKTKIDAESLNKLASIFNVSIDYLLERSYPLKINNGLSQDEILLLNSFRSLNSSGQNLILTTLSSLNKDSDMTKINVKETSAG